MPFYEYQCGSCSHYVEVLQKISEAPLRKCPDCGKQTLQRLMSAPVFRLKGGGWYETDFKSDGEQKRNLAAGREEGAETKAEDAKKDSDTAKTETKPADAKPEPSKTEQPAAKKTTVAKPAVKAASRPGAKPAKAASKAAVRKKKAARR